MTATEIDKRQFVLLPVLTLLQRELVRFYRQKSRIVGVVASPLVFWFFLGSGFGKSFASSSTATIAGHSVNYLEYFFPGTIILTILFSSIFSSISIIEDRHEGFLQSVLVAPVTRGSIVLGKMLGGAVLAFAQAVIFIALSPLVGIPMTASSFIAAAVVAFIVSFGLSGLGFAIAWKMDSTQGFHAIMNLFLVPMWLLSGSVFPLEGTPQWLHALMSVNPVTYCTSALRESLYLSVSPTPFSSTLIIAVIISVGFALLTFSISSILARKHT